MKYPVVGDITIKEQPKLTQPESKSFFAMVTDFFTGKTNSQPLTNPPAVKTLPSQYSDTEVVSQNKTISSLESDQSDETPRKVASENKGRIRVDLGRQTDRKETTEIMPFELAPTLQTKSKAQNFD